MGIFGESQLLSVARESCPRAFDTVFVFDLDCVFEGDEMAEVFDFTFWRQDLDVHPLNCDRVVFCRFVMSCWRWFLSSWGVVVGRAPLWLW